MVSPQCNTIFKKSSCGKNSMSELHLDFCWCCCLWLVWAANHRAFFPYKPTGFPLHLGHLTLTVCCGSPTKPSAKSTSMVIHCLQKGLLRQCRWVEWSPQQGHFRERATTFIYYSQCNPVSFVNINRAHPGKVWGGGAEHQETWWCPIMSLQLLLRLWVNACQVLQ